MKHNARTLRRMAGLLAAQLPRLRLEQVADPRKARGRRHSLPTMLRTTLVGLMAGCKSLGHVEKLTTEMRLPMRRQIGLKGRMPDTTLRDVLCALEPREVRGALHSFVRSAHRRHALAPEGVPFGVVAMDGKSTWISGCDDFYAQAQSDTQGGMVRTVTCALVSARGRPCIDVVPIPASTNEMGHFEQALKGLVAAYGKARFFDLITYDAGACSLDNASTVVQQGLAYLFALNDAQPTLYQEATRVLGLRAPMQCDASTEDVVGSTTVIRRVYLTEEMAGWHDWEHLQTVLRVESVTLHKDGRALETLNRYFLCSLPQRRLTPVQWLRVVRSHWGVENNNHHTLDTVFEEDDRPWIVADPRGMVVLAVLRRIAYTILTLFRSVTQRAEEQRLLPWQDLLRWLAHTLLLATDAHLGPLRPRLPVTAPL